MRWGHPVTRRLRQTATAVHRHWLVAQHFSLCLWGKWEKWETTGFVTDTFRLPTSLCGNEKLHSQLLNTKEASPLAVSPRLGCGMPVCECVCDCVLKCAHVWIIEQRLHGKKARMKAKAVCFLYVQHCKGRRALEQTLKQMLQIWSSQVCWASFTF